MRHLPQKTPCREKIMEELLIRAEIIDLRLAKISDQLNILFYFLLGNAFAYWTYKLRRK
jgi:hypothetical protein